MIGGMFWSSRIKGLEVDRRRLEFMLNTIGCSRKQIDELITKREIEVLDSLFDDDQDTNEEVK